ncbi:Uncharacterised protein [Legionella pneumophila]|nr:hypothetical protein LPE509_02691 [Legionella pneumophila subsp. pneumophila LPE509]CZH01476.1 Uncharacterised protein [Legionella pneumophila]CZH14056.1 Uncharacterised protein [Legionella pneumophila]CZH16689.1 Uncharacterised protein [Legionella pneumophila]CZH49847.1 Uncharacterised protein [Legionella pneumophila]
MITGINHITLAIKNLNKSFAFYAKILVLKQMLPTTILRLKSLIPELVNAGKA